ncbi:hypothetical protein N9O03_03000 [Candidatus Pelagibacter sp.]|nr:hypothetical protein [Candidatus Pelagibacter sp.]
MKKLFSTILVLGLLLSGNAFAAKVYKTKVISKSEHYIIFTVKRPFNNINQTKWDNTWQILATESQAHCKIYQDKSHHFSDSLLGKSDDDDRGFATYKSRFICARDEYEALNYFKKLNHNNFVSHIQQPTHYYVYNGKFKLNEKKVSALNEEKTLKEKQVKLGSLIIRAKDTCKSLGFKEGTEKFTDCALKLYSQSVELAAEQNKTVVMQPQSSGSNVMTIYDPVRDNQRMINQGQRMLSGACTLGIDC